MYPQNPLSWSYTGLIKLWATQPWYFAWCRNTSNHFLVIQNHPATILLQSHAIPTSFKVFALLLHRLLPVTSASTPTLITYNRSSTQAVTTILLSVMQKLSHSKFLLVYIQPHRYTFPILVSLVYYIHHVHMEIFNFNPWFLAFIYVSESKI